ncbi:MAG: 4Fe-4S binding protein [Chitinispirillaceae bacterium]|jgi:NAD-dependent dihydropyrimidine dehydrogenase PreA subunit|nr:4Fe-4S binding protein [Chitinispirillaceae bacterium]
MAIKINNDLCDRCGTCISVCASSALVLMPDALHVDQCTCTDCGSCVKICPFAALSAGDHHGS